MAVVVLLAAGLGLRQGLLATALSETEVINRYAAQYLKDRSGNGTGDTARLTDCVAYPASPEDRTAWLIVSCGPTPYDASLHYEYVVGWRGELLRRGRPARTNGA